MKRILLVLMAMSLSSIAFAQDAMPDRIDQELTFVYIAHDHTTPVDELCDRLSDLVDVAKYEKDQALILYLPNSDMPKVLYMNLPGDNRDEFSDMLGELRYKSAHEIFPEIDVKQIPEIFNQIDFINSDGTPSFSKFTLVYYVTPVFWKLGYNEGVIANLYFTLDLAKLSKSYFKQQIWHSKDDGLKVNEELPFGSKDLCENYNFLLLNY